MTFINSKNNSNQRYPKNSVIYKRQSNKREKHITSSSLLCVFVVYHCTNLINYETYNFFHYLCIIYVVIKSLIILKSLYVIYNFRSSQSKDIGLSEYDFIVKQTYGKIII